MDMNAIEAKWQEIWEEKKLYKIDLETVSEEEKFYVLVMFSYPSGARLHVGHWYNYGPTDTYARFKWMNGKKVFQPMGFDAFGLPAENYAIKTGVHPQESTEKNIETMTKQLKSIGAMYQWDNDVVTCRKDYYKWNQWLFLKLYEKGLAYRANAPVNWCPNDKTVLANEQVQDGACERCGTVVVRKNLTQWFFKITEYAEELLNDLDKIDWPESTKAKQREWIGKSTGAEIEFKIKGSDKCVTVFTTRPDTLYGVSFISVAPELDLLQEIRSEEQKQAVQDYIEDTKKRSELERLKGDEKTGVFTGAYAINPINGKEIPIWVSDYVLITYGTGVVMAVPGHDQRDFEFAKLFALPIRKVILEKGKEPASPLTEAYTGQGILINSEEFDGYKSKDAKGKIVKKLGEKASFKTNYKLRDWLISRQRYWGTPIPVAYDENGNVVAIDEQELPVELPLDVEFNPEGESALKSSESFKYYLDPKTGKKLTREIDTMDTFVCSSWYYLRYISPFEKNRAIHEDNEKKWIPVDKYVGGSDHAVMHLLYARFIHKALRDMGYVHSDEPFSSLTHQGMILGPDGQKMSKSKGNVVNPDDYVEKHGADVFRCSLMFGFAYELGGPWDDGAIQSITRFFGRIERMVENHRDRMNKELEISELSKADKELRRVLHNSIKGISEDLERLQFNTSISRLMEFVNEYNRYKAETTSPNEGHLISSIKSFLKLLAPFAPHFAEELWERCGLEGYVTCENWPKFNAAYLELDEISYVVQFNGKKRFELALDRNCDRNQIEEKLKENHRYKELSESKTVIKIIIVENKLINVVLK